MPTVSHWYLASSFPNFFAIFGHPQEEEILHTRFHFDQIILVLIFILYMIAFLLLVTDNSGQNWILAVVRNVLVSSMGILNTILVIDGPPDFDYFLSIVGATQVNYYLYVILMAFAVTLALMLKIYKKKQIIAAAD